MCCEFSSVDCWQVVLWLSWWSFEVCCQVLHRRGVLFVITGVVCSAGDRVCESHSSVDRLAERSRDETSRMNATSAAAQHEGVVNVWTADLSSSLFVAVPSDVVASTLAHERSGIAQSAGVKLRAVSAEAARSIGTSAVEITGPVAARAVACYFVQVQLWHLSALSV